MRWKLPVGVLIVFVARVLLFAENAAREAHAEEPPSQILEEINREIVSQSTELASLNEERKRREQDLKKIAEKVSASRKRIGELEQQRDQLERDRSQKQLMLEETNANITRTKALASARLKAAYLYRASSVLPRLMRVEYETLIARNALFLAKIHAFDHSTLDRLRQLRSERDLQLDEVTRLLNQSKKLGDELRTRGRSLEQELGEREAGVKRVNAARARVEDLLARLRAQALRLETVVQSITQSEEALNSRVQPHSAAGASNAGAGLGGGNLVAPLAGTVVSEFGAKHPASFAEIVRARGMEFFAASGTAVRSIQAGRVVFAGVMPGYGQMIVVDHGQRWYSVYSRLIALWVEAGAEVSAGKELGTIGESDDRGANFYFEIRQGSTPINPRRILKGLG